ncbi:MAG: 2-C-methyl-D-erythritol 4-phosphate cytidylyltransferase [Clostridiales Family XIII bacterium]|nr:2-C-methyl-D-erythritol 4-phosphate cytidylyltransferase [Clostridiales Family XIII bacterium]
MILAAGGSGARFGGDLPKQFADLGGRSVLEASAELFAADARVDEIVVVVPGEYRDFAEDSLRVACQQKKLTVVTGGADRTASVNAGLAAVSAADGLVLIHDAARPFVSREVIDSVIEAALAYGAAVPAVPVTDTIYETEPGGGAAAAPRFAASIPERNMLRAVQTPQGFDLALLRAAHQKALKDDLRVTDDGMPALAAGARVAVVDGDPANIKITTPEDMPFAALRGSGFRVGFGFDAHRFDGGRPLILGGVRIPFEKGLAGHSDADVLTHALMDAILGALGAGDIGQRFPDTDDAYKGVSSMLLLADVASLMQGEGYEIANCDMTLVTERPKMAPHRRAVEESLATALGTEPKNVSLKATTTEKLGFTGREEGIAAEAAVLLRQRGEK